MGCLPADRNQLHGISSADSMQPLLALTFCETGILKILSLQKESALCFRGRSKVRPVGAKVTVPVRYIYSGAFALSCRHTTTEKYPQPLAVILRQDSVAFSSGA